MEEKQRVRFQVPVRITDFDQFISEYLSKTDNDIDTAIGFLLNGLREVFPEKEFTALPSRFKKLLEVYPYKTREQKLSGQALATLLTNSKLFWKLIYQIQYRQAPLKECGGCKNYKFSRSNCWCSLDNQRSVNPTGTVVRKDDRCIDYNR